LGCKIRLRIHGIRLIGALALLIGALLAPSAALAEPEEPGIASVTGVESGEITISADFAEHGRHNTESVTLLRGRCKITQGSTLLRANRMVIWRSESAGAENSREKITVYVEDGVHLEQPGSTLTERVLLLDLTTKVGVQFQTPREVHDQPVTEDAFYRRGVRQRGLSRSNLHQTQYRVETDPALEPELQSVQLQKPAGGIRRIRVFPRSVVPYNVESFESRETTPPEQVWVISGGVNVLIDGLAADSGTVDLSADRMVIWTLLSGASDLNSEGVFQTNDTPMQIYLEGNIQVRQGTNLLRATQGFFNAQENRALMLNAELRTRPAQLPLNLRVRADRIRQLSANTFQADRAWLTTSEFGKPGYRVEMSDVFIEPRAGSWVSGGHAPEIDPETGEPMPGTRMWATTLNNKMYVGDIPIFYYPYITAPMEDVNIPLRTVGIGNDRIFGTQVYSSWNMFKLLGMAAPENTRWDLHLNYLSKRGPQIGTSGGYSGTDRWGLPGAYRGDGGAYFIYDTGLDNLGIGRQDLIPQQKERGRVLIHDRQELPHNVTILSEFAFLSDRNYLEEYNQIEYNTTKDYETLTYLNQSIDNWGWTGIVRPRLYDYYTETEWLPRGDLYGLGEPLLGGLLSWSSHSYVGYANQRIAEPPSDPNDLYSVLPFEGNGQGGVYSTRHELDMPFNVGPGIFVPYVLGEAIHWDDDFQGQSLDRLYGSAGIRGSIEFWKVFPTVQNSIFNLNGLAHKMVFDADYSNSHSNQPLSAVPQYNEFDDNSQEQFRRRLLYNTFGGTLPDQFAPQFYGVRQGVAHNVTAPYNELVATQQVLRMGWRHRLQTKVGPINNQRIRNWMTLDLETSFFPQAERDNFGADFGMYTGRYAWNFSERTTFTAGGIFDTFEGGQKLWNVAMISQRSTRGSVYLGMRQVAGGVLNSQIITASYSYNMSPKWVSSVGTSYDVGEHQNRGQTVTLTRVGADFLIHAGFVLNPTRKNVGFGLMVEPRFMQGLGTGGTQLGSLVGSQNAR